MEREYLDNDEDYQKAFMFHTDKLADAMIGFCMNLLTTYSNYEGRTLTDDEMDYAASHEIQEVLRQIQEPRFMAIVKEKAIKKFKEVNESPL